MRVNLNVPYSDREYVRSKGAKWDIARKVWYIENLEDVNSFLRWMPTHLVKPSKPPTKGKKPKVGRNSSIYA